MRGDEPEEVYAVFNEMYPLWWKEDFEAVKAILVRFASEQRNAGRAEYEAFVHACDSDDRE